MEDIVCGECGAQLTGTDKTCRMLLDDITTWDFEDYLGIGQTHLLTILCYNLQHPSLYSREGLAYGKGVLMDTVAAQLVTPEDIAARKPIDMTALRIGATEGNIASYGVQIVWTTTVADVVAGGAQGYPERVRAWGESIFNTLKNTQNL